MSKSCYITGKKAMSGNSKSHSLQTTKRKFKANLQKVKIVEDGKIKTVYISARALKSGKVERA